MTGRRGAIARQMPHAIVTYIEEVQVKYHRFLLNN